MENNKNLMRKLFIIILFSLLFLILIPATLLVGSSTKSNEINSNEINTLNSTNQEPRSENEKIDKINFTGIETHGTDWTDHYFAPYVDMSAWSIPHSVIPGGGPADLTYLQKNENTTYYNLGFVQAYEYGGVYNTGTEYGTILNWGWGGFDTLNESHKTTGQYAQINQTINDFRNINSNTDVTVSFGGAHGTPFWMASGVTEQILVNTYEYIIDGYNLTTIDLDIEGEKGENLAGNELNAKAIKQVQDDTGVRVSITLPTTKDGLDNAGKAALKPYIEEGVEIEVINIMAMYMGGTNEDVQTKSALDGLANQVEILYSQAGKEMPIDESKGEDVYSMLGVTNTIGHESTYDFTLNEAKEVITNAINHDIGMLSFWCANRDGHLNGYGTNNGIYDEWAFSELYNSFLNHDSGESAGTPPGIDTGGENTKPEPVNNLIEDDHTGTSVTAKWDASPSEDVSYYETVLKDGNGNSIGNKKVYPSSSLKVTYDNLQSNSDYSVSVTAVDFGGLESDAKSVSISTDFVDTEAPVIDSSIAEITTYSTSGTQWAIDVKLDKNGALNTDEVITKFKVTLDGGAYSEIIHNNDFDDDGYATVTFKQDQFLCPWLDIREGQTHEIEIIAYDNSGNASIPLTLSIVIGEDDGGETNPIVTPDSPANLLVSDITTNSASISWDAADNADSYSVAYIKQGHSQPSYSSAKKVNGTSAQLTDLSQNTSYSVYVWSNNNADGTHSSTPTKVDFTTEEEVVLLQPQNIELVSHEESIDATWDNPTGSFINQVYITEAGGNAPQDYEYTSISSRTSYTFTDLNPDTSYDVYIRTSNQMYVFGEPVVTTEKTSEATTAVDNVKPELPNELDLGLRLSSTESSMTVNWNNAATDNDAVDYYEIVLNEYGNDVDWSKSEKEYIDSSDNEYTQLSHTFTGLMPSTYYEINMRAVDVSGNISDDVITTQLSTRDSIDTAPPKIVDFNMGDITNSTAQVTWVGTDAIDESGRESDSSITYTLTLKQDGHYVDSVTTTANEWTFTNLEEGTNYSVEIQARDDAFNFSETLTLDFITEKIETGGGNNVLPMETTAPDNFMATEITPGSAHVRWDAVENADHYQVSIIQDNHKNFFTSETNEYDFEHLDSNSTYLIGVSAISGNGTVSNESLLQITTLGVENFDEVQNATATFDDGVIDINWDEVKGASGYVVRFRSISIGEKNSKSVSNWDTVSTEDTHATISGLNESSVYQFVISPTDNSGEYDSSISSHDSISWDLKNLPSGRNSISVWAIILIVFSIIAIVASTTLGVFFLKSKDKNNNQNNDKDQGQINQEAIF